ncbi:hypothetical protein MTO96_043693 [Rhipicephalus appendiculatus]
MAFSRACMTWSRDIGVGSETRLKVRRTGKEESPRVNGNSPKGQRLRDVTSALGLRPTKHSTADATFSPTALRRSRSATESRPAEHALKTSLLRMAETRTAVARVPDVYARRRHLPVVSM